MSKIGISTVWCSKEAQTAEELLKPLLDLEVDGLELEYRIPESIFVKLVPLLKTQHINILSLHNFCPHPEKYWKLPSSGDLFSLSSLDKNERAEAVKWTRRTLEWAEELEAKAVVLHLGDVDLGRENSPRQLYRRIKESAVGEEERKMLIKRHLILRGERQGKHLDAVLFSLDRLDREAERRGISLGIENRYYYHQIPNYKEIGLILDNFGSAGYWHDFGHGAVQQWLGLLPHLQPLKTYQSSLLGVHLHDAIGLEDHMGLGQGSIPYEDAGRLLPAGALRILELRPRTTLPEVRASISYVRKHLVSG